MSLLDELFAEAALEDPGVGMPESVYQAAQAGWVPSRDEFLEQDPAAWSCYFLFLYHFFMDRDHLA